MNRCYVCHRLIWPWQRAGFYVMKRRALWWHARKCGPYPKDGKW